MKNALPLSALLLAMTTAAQAECYADYKAKRDDPLRLHYGVAQINGACTVEDAATELTPRLAADQWQLLSIEGVFDSAGLDEREESAGDYYLRY
ncbi:MAG: hypothetical protein AAGL89_15610 [Pseudomonadota bacterium]